MHIKLYHYLTAFMWRQKRRFRSLILLFFSRESIFNHYYKANKWGSVESKSGEGSHADETKMVRQYLTEIINKYDIASILDAPCGDFNWMRYVDLNNIKYLGADIVNELITLNAKKYSKENINFLKLDICKDDLPKSDLMLCRDALVHFSNHDVLMFLENIKKSEINYLLTTTFPELKENIDISTGMWRPINLCDAPFHLSKPILILNEGYSGKNGRYKDKSLALWEVNSI